MKNNIIIFILILCFTACKSPSEKMERSLYDDCMKYSKNIKQQFDKPKLYCEIYAELVSSKFTDDEAKCYFKDKVGVNEKECRYNAIYINKKSKYLNNRSEEFYSLLNVIKDKYYKKQ